MNLERLRYEAVREKIVLSILIPCLNEVKYITSCLDSLIENDFNHNNYEILIIDGGSTDGTLDILNKYLEKYAFIKIIKNPKKTKSAALNIGIKESAGDIIMRIDAHAIYDKNYISVLVDSLYSDNIDNVGGVRNTYVPANGSSLEIAISLMISNPLIVGNTFYRTGVLSKKKIVDTVFCGCYKKKIFDKIGFFNENLIRTQDREFNKRLINSGRKILLNPKTSCTYFSRTKFADYIKWNWNGAKWLGYASKFTNVKMLSSRNYIPTFFSLYILILTFIIMLKFDTGDFFLTLLIMIMPLNIYLLIMVAEGLKQSFKYQRFFLIIFFPLMALVTHFSYGIALIYGRIKSFL